MFGGSVFGAPGLGAPAFALKGEVAPAPQAAPGSPEDGGHGAAAYRLESTPGDVLERFDAEQLALLEKLNRVDLDHLPGLEHLILPDQWDLEPEAHSPLPRHLPKLEEHGKALVVHQPLQVFAGYEDGELVHWGPVSTGRREHPTPEGLFHLTWRSRGRVSTVNPEWYLEWYYNFHNQRGLSFHRYPLPGVPASQACVRLLERDARWLFGWGEGWVLDEEERHVLETGTPVWILGAYDYDAPPPWTNPDDPHPSPSRADVEDALRTLAEDAESGEAGSEDR